MASRRPLPDWSVIDMSVMRRPYFGAFAKRLVQRMPNWLVEVAHAWDMSAANVPEDRQRTFWRIAKAAVQVDGSALQHVPEGLLLRPEYEEVARLAVADNPRVLAYVPQEAPWFMDLCKTVLSRFPILLLDIFFDVPRNLLDVEQYAELLLHAREEAERHTDETRARIARVRAERDERLREAHGNPDHPGAWDAATLDQWIDTVLMPDYARAREEMEALNAPELRRRQVWYV
jgi:hypothetical protein